LTAESPSASFAHVGDHQSNQSAEKKKWTFLRKFRWAVYCVFIAGMGFVAVCLIVGILSNLRWRYSDLDIPVDRPDELAELGSLELRDCLTALETLNSELQDNLEKALAGAVDRETLLREWKEWSRQWRKRFEKLGISCRLTEYRYDEHPTLGLLAGIYRLLDSFQKHHTRLVKSFVLEHARSLYELHELFTRAQRQIVKLEGQVVE
jgi:hypothetical protein